MSQEFLMSKGHKSHQESGQKGYDENGGNWSVFLSQTGRVGLLIRYIQNGAMLTGGVGKQSSLWKRLRRRKKE